LARRASRLRSAAVAYQHRLVKDGQVVGTLGLGSQLSGILLGASFCVILGMWDDRRSLPPIVKLLAQIIAAYVAMMYGVRVAGWKFPAWTGSVPSPSRPV
jgi:UDP-N-acetylmuramyl pentapeptide phosphotransferase/UDP-N-acetylglucosamine-1-phosphate transferase